MFIKNIYVGEGGHNQPYKVTSSTSDCFMLTLTGKIRVKYQKLLANANPVWTNNYVKRPNISWCKYQQETSYWCIQCVNIQWYIYTSTAPIWDHINHLMWKPWLSYCWCLFCHMHTTHKLSFDSFVSLAGAATSVILLWQKFCHDNDKRCVFVATNTCLLQQNFCCDKNDTCGSSHQRLFCGI